MSESRPKESTGGVSEPPAADTDASDGSLIRRYREGEDGAATSLYRRYARRLRILAARQCGTDFGGRFDADDIIQSVFRTFFQGARGRAYDVPPGGEIWGLLMVLTVNKIRNHLQHHRAGKRTVYRTAADAELDHHPLARDESAAAFLRLVLDEQLADLPESNRSIVRMRMEGYGVNEIAEHSGRALRTVERVLQNFRDRLTSV
ncbi:sigma-70 family RNA polymerase sigma factor [Fimbriiglobus ruber]|uniref:RNA polymerase sigma-70 ECF-like HTH domain-containing protein n=1 Tax=Fimbriiglobus ruber TaxID=1908690 RepID=A0A225DE90_9BACT|nr:sigma-70 family RNA polymerase sigma factor [Fimbriiglobus ruber]OWK36828.1 hypothetical protein FRUB_09391 [Fimbriiglobus ruber]